MSKLILIYYSYKKKTMSANYNPKEVKRASQLVKEQEALRQDHYKELHKIGGIRNDAKDYTVQNVTVDPNYISNAVKSSDPRQVKDANNLLQSAETARIAQSSMYPFTYDIPDRDYWESRARYTDEDGMALYPDQKSVMGKVFVGPEYFDYIRRINEREEAIKFQEWVLNQLDISTPVKKDYVKRRFPHLFDLILQGQAKNLREKFTKDMVLLMGPKTIEDWRYVYNNIVKKDLYTRPLINNRDMFNNYQPALPYPVINPEVETTNAQKSEAIKLQTFKF